MFFCFSTSLTLSNSIELLYGKVKELWIQLAIWTGIYHPFHSQSHAFRNSSNIVSTLQCFSLLEKMYLVDFLWYLMLSKYIHYAVCVIFIRWDICFQCHVEVFSVIHEILHIFPSTITVLQWQTVARSNWEAPHFSNAFTGFQLPMRLGITRFCIKGYICQIYNSMFCFRLRITNM